MSDKIRGTIAILVGVFALYQSYVLYEAQRRDWHLWIEVAAGSVLIAIGVWRVMRKPDDPAAGVLK